MVKDVDSYLLTASIDRKFIVKVRPFSFDMEDGRLHQTDQTDTDMEDYTKPTKRDFNPDLYILHVATNDE